MATPQKIRCQVDKIINHSNGVYTVNLLPERLLPRFNPGQFLHLSLDGYDTSSFWPESRVFSIASAPSQRDRLIISYSVKGKYTKRMEKELKEGKWVWTKMPYGDFIIRDNCNVVLIAGGTGITAFISFINGLSSTFPKKVFLAYGVRNPDLLLYLPTIIDKLNICKQFQAFFFIERTDEDAGSLKVLSNSFMKGVISIDRICSLLENSNDLKFYIAGPPEMVQHTVNNLRNRSISNEMISVDAWE